MRRTAALLLLAACSTVQNAPTPRSRQVILFIGDGMGVSQVTLGRLAKGGPDARLALDAFPVVGLAKTHSADQWVTDSAASATALASGAKTSNLAIGVDPRGQRLTSLLQLARANGCATGLVTTSKITHATPAPFAAYARLRTEEAAIAAQYLDADVDVLFGGGARFFPPALVTRFTEKGYHVVRDRRELEACQGRRLLGLFAESHVDYIPDREPTCPTLVEMTRKAVALLGDRPFFLMIEGARIDMACHANDAVTAALEMIEFDEAVAAAVEAAPDALIVVTADHATAGMAITEKAMERWKKAPQVKASAERIDTLIRPDTTKKGDPVALRAALQEHCGIADVTEEEATAYAAISGLYDPAARIGEIISRRVGVTFMPFEYRSLKPNITHGHDGAMVSVYARGPGATRFSGTMDNTEIPARIRELTGW
jgi:alkaline phosphatase